MAKTLNIGDSYTTAKSKVTGTVQEIVRTQMALCVFA